MVWGLLEGKRRGKDCWGEVVAAEKGADVFIATSPDSVCLHGPDQALLLPGSPHGSLPHPRHGAQVSHQVVIQLFMGLSILGLFTKKLVWSSGSQTWLHIEITRGAFTNGDARTSLVV